MPHSGSGEPLPRIAYLLDDATLNGPVTLNRQLVAARHLAHVPLDVAGARTVISKRCQWWGGGFHLLVPDEWVAETTDMWEAFGAAADVDTEEDCAVWPEESANTWVCRQRDGRCVPLLTTLAGRKPGVDLPAVHVFDVDPDDPWAVAYLAQFGWLGTVPDDTCLQQSRLAGLTSFAPFVTVQRERIVGSIGDFEVRVTGRSAAMSPVELSLTFLNNPGRWYAMSRVPGVFPSPEAMFDWHGPNVVVVYEPGSIRDLCVLWNLRVDHHLPAGAPLGVPVSEAEAAIPRLLPNAIPGRFGDETVVLVSMTVPLEQLAQIAAAVGPNVSAVPVTDVLRPGPRVGRESTTIGLFDGGRAEVTAWSSADETDLPDASFNYGGLGLRARFRPQDEALPRSASLAMRGWGSEWIEGACDVEGKAMRVIEVTWPTGWTVLEAAARDQGLWVRRSAPGKTAEALLRTMGSILSLRALTDPAVVAMLNRLCEGSGMSWFRTRFRDLTADIDPGDGRLAALEARVEQLAAAGPEEPTRTLTLDTVKNALQSSRADAILWLEWAEAVGLLVRGVKVSCPACGHTDWQTVAELAPPVACRGCGKLIARPFPPDRIDFQFRASTALANVAAHDALPHLLTLKWMTDRFARSAHGPAAVYGAHPGVEFYEPDNPGTTVGEADVALVMADGSIVVGECKRNAAGLNENELDKLQRLADRLRSPWTFVATTSPISEANGIWATVRRDLPHQPRFALYAEHLYGTRQAADGMDPFELSDAPDTPAVTDAVRWGHTTGHPDWALHDAWERRPRS